MAQIHVLDKHTAELIAAGEVVERPASVVKELVENAIDASASSVAVSIERGGVGLIEIADNGSGIEAEYIPTAFLRHATSKIAREEDLEDIRTLGFRGEALASVASVARVELLTKTESDEYAYLYRIHGGEEQGLEPAARPVGTTLTVRDLFFNTPARMKFLKKDTSEGNYVSDVVTQLALSHPDIAFKFVREGKIQFQTPGDGSLLGAAYAALSRDFAKDLVEVAYTSGNCRVHGLVTPPKSARASRSMQFFFVNGRFVKNRTMMAALEAAYKGVMMQGRFPGCVLTVEMPPQLVDVNVHPAKTEVRFAREKEIFDVVYAAVKGVLLTPQSTERSFSFGGGKGDVKPAAAQRERPGDVPAAGRLADAVASHARETGDVLKLRAQPAAAPLRQETQAYGDMLRALASAPVAYRTESRDKTAGEANETMSEQEDAPAPLRAGTERKAVPAEEEEPIVSVPEQTAFGTPAANAGSIPLRFVGEIFDTYIVTQRGDDMCLLDKHAAHERAIYERLAASYGNVSSQMLLMPVTVRISAEEKDALLQSEMLLHHSGLEVEDFGGNSVVVRAVPTDVVPEGVEDLVVELAAHLVSNPKYTVSEKTEWVLHSIACRSAIKAGDKTHTAHLLRLAEDVLDGRVPPFCPHGRPIVLKITKKELEKQFGRQG